MFKMAGEKKKRTIRDEVATMADLLFSVHQNEYRISCEIIYKRDLYAISDKKKQRNNFFLFL